MIIEAHVKVSYTLTIDTCNKKTMKMNSNLASAGGSHDVGTALLTSSRKTRGEVMSWRLESGMKNPSIQSVFVLAVSIFFEPG